MGCCLMVGADDAAALTDYWLQALEFRFNCFRTVDNGKLVEAAPEFQGRELFPYLNDIHAGIDVNGQQTIQSCLQELGNQQSEISIGIQEYLPGAPLFEEWNDFLITWCDKFIEAGGRDHRAIASGQILFKEYRAGLDNFQNAIQLLLVYIQLEPGNVLQQFGIIIISHHVFGNTKQIPGTPEEALQPQSDRILTLCGAFPIGAIGFFHVFWCAPFLKCFQGVSLEHFPVILIGDNRADILHETAVFRIFPCPAILIPADGISIGILQNFLVEGDERDTEADTLYRVQSQCLFMVKHRLSHHGIIMVFPWLIRCISCIQVVCRQGGKVNLIQKTGVQALLIPGTDGFIPGIHAFNDSAAVQTFIGKGQGTQFTFSAIHIRFLLVVCSFL